MHSLLSVFQRLSGIVLFGTIACLLVSFPIVFALAVHFTASHFGHPHPNYWSLRVGLLSLMILPLGIAGNALCESLEHARRKGVIQHAPTAPLPSTSVPAISPFDEKDIVSVWQTSLEVQQHFNDLELQIRNFAITLLVAVMGGTAFTLKEHYNIQLGDQPVSLAVVVLLAGILGWLAFYFMDRHWYHRLLIGSVMHTINNIETPYDNFAPLGLSKRIGHESAILIWKFNKPRNKRTHWIEIHSTEKIDLFYSAGLFFFGVLIAGALLTPQAPVPVLSISRTPVRLQEGFSVVPAAPATKQSMIAK
jgi:hypothetical protein